MINPKSKGCNTTIRVARRVIKKISQNGVDNLPINKSTWLTKIGLSPTLEQESANAWLCWKSRVDNYIKNSQQQQFIKNKKTIGKMFLFTNLFQSSEINIYVREMNGVHG